MRQYGVIALGFAVLTAAAPVVGAQATQQQPAQREQKHEFHAQRNGLRAFFRGIQLSDAEKASVKTVWAKYQPQLASIRESMRPELQAAREARQRGDTAAMKAAFEKTKDQREHARKVLEEARNEVRGALTPEHQKQFDQNVARFQQRMAERAKDWRGGAGRGRNWGGRGSTEPGSR